MASFCLMRLPKGWVAMLPTQLLSVLRKPTAYAFVVPALSTGSSPRVLEQVRNPAFPSSFQTLRGTIESALISPDRSTLVFDSPR